MTISLRALILRINRRLRPDSRRLHVTRARWVYNLGQFHIVDEDHNSLVDVFRSVADLEALGRELGCLRTGEEVAL